MICKLCTISVDNNFTPCLREGNENHILFIGEAPGHTENKLKIPFTGKAGIKLREFVKYYHLEDVSSYTNVIKCKPPRNRDPLLYEISNCRPFLLKDISEVKPRIIVLLGRIAIESFTHVKIEYIKDVVNKPFTIGSIIVLPMYHPSYILRNEMDVKYFESFNILSEMYNKINKYYNRRTFKPKV